MPNLKKGSLKNGKDLARYLLICSLKNMFEYQISDSPSIKTSNFTNNCRRYTPHQSTTSDKSSANNIFRSFRRRRYCASRQRGGPNRRHLPQPVRVGTVRTTTARQLQDQINRGRCVLVWLAVWKVWPLWRQDSEQNQKSKSKSCWSSQLVPEGKCELIDSKIIFHRTLSTN